MTIEGGTTTQMSQQQLEATLWRAANSLRGPVDPGDFKAYVFPVMFAVFGINFPVGVLIYRLNDLIYANRAFLEWTGYPTLQGLRDAGGLDSLFIETAPGPTLKNGNGGKTLTITTPAGKQMPVQGRLFATQWAGDNALVLMLNTAAAADRIRRRRQSSCPPQGWPNPSARPRPVNPS